jgi:hypothetical protein
VSDRNLHDKSMVRTIDVQEAQFDGETEEVGLDDISRRRCWECQSDRCTCQSRDSLLKCYSRPEQHDSERDLHSQTCKDRLKRRRGRAVVAATTVVFRSLSVPCCGPSRERRTPERQETLSAPAGASQAPESPGLHVHGDVILVLTRVRVRRF